MLSTLSLRYLLSSDVMAWMLLLCVIISIIATIFVRPSGFAKSRVYVFISILASVAVLFIGLSLMISAYSFEKQEDTTRKAITKESIDKLWLYPNQLIVNSTHARPQFLQSLYTNNPHLSSIKPKEEPATVISALEEQNLAIVLIQAWEDFLTLRKLDQTGDAVWMNNFIQWAQSPYLKEYFDFLKYNFKETTIRLGTLLFEYGKTLPTPTRDPELYKTTVQKMLKDPRVISLFDEASR